MELVMAKEKQQAYLNLASLYGYQESLSIPQIGQAIDTNGMLLMPGTEDYANGTKEGYVVVDQGRAVGIVGIDVLDSDLYMIEQFFATKAFLNEEFVHTVLDKVFLSKKGTLQMHLLKVDEAASELVLQFFEEKQLSVKREDFQEQAWLYTIENK